MPGSRATAWYDVPISRITEDSSTDSSERVRARLEGWDIDSLTWRRVKVNADGELLASLDASAVTIGTVAQGAAGSSAWKVDGSAVTQPVSAAALPLPSGASTGALQTTGNTSLSSIDTKIPSSLTVTSTRLLVDGSGVTQPVSAATLPLPTGAATGAKQDTGNTSLASLDTKLPSSLTVTSTRLLVDGSGVTQPVSGPLTDTQLRLTPVPVSGTVTTGGLTDTQLRASAVPVSLATLPALAAGSAVIGHVIVDTAPSTAVTNAGTFAVQATLAAETTKVIGTVNRGWTLSSGTDSVSAAVSNFPATQAVTQSTSPWVTQDTSSAVASGGLLPSYVGVVGGYDGNYVHPLKTDTFGAVVVSNTNDDLLLELRKQTRAMALLLGQFTGETDIEGMVNY